jgi:ubiquinone/menaquinone biosynthesis C-methylase UbiE
MNTNKRLRRKWDKVSRHYDYVTFMDVRGKNAKIRQKMLTRGWGKILEVGIGTGHNIRFYPPGRNIIGIDISEGMLSKAKTKALNYPGNIHLLSMDVENLAFKDHSFDTIVTSCVFCSVPDPIAGLKEIRRVLKPNGKLLMYEHVLSQRRLLKFVMNLLAPLIVRILGVNINRNTVENIKKSGMDIIKVENVRFLDIFKRIDAKASSTL